MRLPEADGLQAQEALAFDDAEQGTVVAGVGSVRERGPTTQKSQLECGPRPLDSVSWDGLDLYFSDGTYAGWFMDQPQPVGVQTTGDVQLDTTTLAKLRAAFADLTVEEPTIGIEWLGGGVVRDPVERQRLRDRRGDVSRRHLHRPLNPPYLRGFAAAG